MHNLDSIIGNYKQLSTEELIEISKTPEQLQVEIIPYLQAELFNRNKKEEAILLSEYLVKRPKSVAELNKEELAQMIKERIDSGEPIESIKLDLKDKGVDMFDLLQVQNQAKSNAFNYLTSLKEDGLNETEIDEKLKSRFSLDETEADDLKRQLRAKGKQNLIIGYSIVIIVGILSLATLGSGGYVGIGGILLIAIGIWRIVEGHRQRK